jgi:hypothetical protein
MRLRENGEKIHRQFWQTVYNHRCMQKHALFNAHVYRCREIIYFNW